MQQPTGKIQRLTKVRDGLQSEWDLRDEKLTKLRESLAIATNVGIKFELEKQIQDEETKNLELAQKLDEIEESLASGSISANLEKLFPEIIVDETNPYQSLFAFTPETAKFFFGRKKEIKKLEEKVKDCNFVPVIGASGSGKSSLVRAGLIPRLLELGWQVLPPIKPGAEPLKTLKLALGELFAVAEQEEIYRIIEQQGLGEIASRLPGDERILLVVDQFEDVFTQSQDRQQQQRFIDRLTSVKQSENRRLVVVTTMRADFVEPWLTSGVLTQAIQDDALFLGVLAGENLEDAIAKPATIQGYNLQPGLLELILRDVANEENCLPLLEFALTELWEKRDRVKHELTVDDYTALGGLVGALDRHAEDIYRDLDGRGQGEWVQRVMLRLVRTGEGMRDTRHRRSKKELLAMGADAVTQAKIEKTIDKLVDGRLLTIDGEKIIDLSHEAMMKGWKRFVKWRESDRDVRRLVAKIEEARREWQMQKQQRQYLLEGRLLGDAKRLLKDRSETLVGETRSFVIKSLEYRKRLRIQQLAGWLIIPVLFVGLPAEYLWREDVVKQDYRRINNNQGNTEERLAVLNIAGGCWAKKQYSWMTEYLRERVFGNCRTLHKANLSGADLSDAEFNAHNLRPLRSTITKSTPINLSDADLSGADLINAKLSGAKLSDANLSGAKLSGADLSGANLSGADLSDVNLRTVNLSGVNLSYVDFTFADLNGVDLSGINLENTYLRDADLSGVNLSGANLRSVSWRHVKLRDVNLSGANLSEAVLFGVDLSGVNLSGVNLKYTDLGNINFDCLTPSLCNNMKDISWNTATTWKGVKGWQHVENIPPALKKELKLP